jgi:cell division protein ZapE
LDIHKAYLTTPGIKKDRSQIDILNKLLKLQSQLVSSKNKASFIQKYIQPTPLIKGIYLWGDVGRGKTFLMDLFFNTLNIKKKRRVHFHRMMNEVKNELAKIPKTEDPMKMLTKKISSNVDVLCFDEFFIEDIADAMLMYKFLEGLFDQGVTMIVTSNSHPDNLYKNGLQRERFVKAIDLISANTEIINISKGIDFRLSNKPSNLNFGSIHNEKSNQLLTSYFKSISPMSNLENIQILINDRYIKSILSAETIIWFDFKSIFSTNRSVMDYIEIAKQYQTVIISEIPVLTENMENEARRFIALIDEFYERNVKLIYTSEISFEKLYQGKKLVFEYERTKSRLSEMASQKYIELAHKP